MSSELPSHVVSAISFVGRSGGAIKTLSGFRKPQHSVPDAANAATNAFLARICSTELSEDAERLFQEVRTGLAYKRKDVALTLASPLATLATRDFSVEITYAVDEADPARYRVTTTLHDLLDAGLARTESFTRIFASRFTEIEFRLKKGVRVEAVIDAIEVLEGENDLSVDYPSDYRHCVIRVENVDAEVRCTGMSLDIVFPRAGSPAELIDAFIAVRDAFQISKVLTGLVEG